MEIFTHMTIINPQILHFGVSLHIMFRYTFKGDMVLVHIVLVFHSILLKFDFVGYELLDKKSFLVNLKRWLNLNFFKYIYIKIYYKIFIIV